MVADVSEAVRASVYKNTKPTNMLKAKHAPNSPSSETMALISSNPTLVASASGVDRSSYIQHQHPHRPHTVSAAHHYPQHVLNPTTSALNLIGTLGLALVIGVIIYDFIAYLFAVYRNTTDSYSPYGRRIATVASDIWTRRSLFSGLNPYLRGRFVT